MPETPIDENSHPALTEHEVRMAGQGLMATPPTDSGTTEQSGERHLCRSVPLRPNRRHDPGALFLGDPFRHTEQ